MFFFFNITRPLKPKLNQFMEQVFEQSLATGHSSNFPFCWNHMNQCLQAERTKLV